MELYDALESSGYSKEEISQKVDKYRDKLMQARWRRWCGCS